MQVYILFILCVLLGLAQRDALAAETRCPGEVDGIRIMLVQNLGILVPVTVNNTGPYTFLIDTGAQITTIDKKLADRLHLTPIGSTTVVGIGIEIRDAVVRLDQVIVGRAGADSIPAAAQDLSMIPGRSRSIDGILGISFLERFDLLIDNEHKLLCLDRTGSLRQKVPGYRIALLRPSENDSKVSHSQPFIVPGWLSGISHGSMSLEIDSGINVPLLFAPGARMSHGVFVVAQPNLRDSRDEGRIFATLPPQNLRLSDCCVLADVVFATPASERDRNAVRDVDGLLPTSLFKSVFLSASEQMAVIAPW